MSWQLQNDRGQYTSGWLCQDNSRVELYLYQETNSFELRPFSGANASWIVIDREDFPVFAYKIEIESGALFDEWCFKIADYLCKNLNCSWSEELKEVTQ